MLCLCRRFACWLAMILISAALWPAAAGESFPFGSELMLDAAPMHGSKQIPMLEIEDDGTASIDLWCTSLHAQATITDEFHYDRAGAAGEPHSRTARSQRCANRMRSRPASQRRHASFGAWPSHQVAAQWRPRRTVGRRHAALPANDELIDAAPRSEKSHPAPTPVTFFRNERRGSSGSVADASPQPSRAGGSAQCDGGKSFSASSTAALTGSAGAIRKSSDCRDRRHSRIPQLRKSRSTRLTR